MPLNQAKGNMYPWVDFTWNPIGGECPHKCSYCSINKLMKYPNIKKKYTGKQRLIENELKTDLKSGKTIFVCAQNDLFVGTKESGLSYNDVYRIIEHTKKFDNTYLYQTKNPFGINGFVFPEKTIFCTTIETNRWYPEIMNNCPKPEERAYYMADMMQEYERYVTIEPIMDFDLNPMVDLIKMCTPKQVNIGANSDPKRKVPEPNSEKIHQLIIELNKFTNVKLKSNLKRLYEDKQFKY